MHTHSLRRSLVLVLVLLLVPLGVPGVFAPSYGAAQTLTPSAIPRPSGAWVASGANWKWRLPSGAYLKNSWARIGSADYYFDAAGVMATGWRRLDAWYYFTASGAKATGWLPWKGDWYYLDPSSGKMATGFVSNGQKRYLLGSEGAMTLGWSRADDDWYYADPEEGGALATSPRALSDGSYAFDSSGRMTTGWARIFGRWQYFDASGRRLHGWLLDRGSWYRLDPVSGDMMTGWVAVAGAWYLLDPSTGAMTTGWARINDSWYWLDPVSGAMATGTVTVEGRPSVFDSSGRWLSYADQHPIIARPSASKILLVEEMTRAYGDAGARYPAQALGAGGAGDITTFATILYEEAVAEGISPELVFSQAMKETGWLRFGGDVRAGQFNFAGIGATGEGAAGASFPSVRIGLRAQIQHLRAYADPQASPARLARPVVDPRFAYVRKGSAPWIEHLGVQENPNGTGWATAKNYGYDLVSMIEAYF